MTTQTRENAAAKNGSSKSRPAITETDVSRTVGDLEMRPGGKLNDTKVQVQFKVAASQANAVAVAGTFNGWNPEKTPLKKNGEAWERTVALPRGRYEYRFVVGGRSES
jgi:1,4-alpha-glucan branching enzyme